MTARQINYEHKACEAVARVLEERLGIVRSNPLCLEKNDAISSSAYLMDLAGRAFAFEHAAIEPFDGPSGREVSFADFAAPIARALDHHMHVPGMYRLTFPADACVGMRAADISQRQEIIIGWVTRKAAELRAEFPEERGRLQSPYGLHNFRKEIVPELGFELHLSRDTMPGLAHGRLFVGRFVPPEFKTLQIKQLVMACERKLLNLMDWQAKGALAVLVIENRDIAVSNQIIVSEVVEKILRTKNNRPDQVWLVDSGMGSESVVWCLARDGTIFPDSGTTARYRTFDSAALDDAQLV